MLYRAKNKIEKDVQKKQTKILLDDHLAEKEKKQKNICLNSTSALWHNTALLETFVLLGQILVSEQVLCNRLDQAQVNCYMTLSFRSRGGLRLEFLCSSMTSMCNKCISLRLPMINGQASF
jgi:hypothetical protein